MVKVRAIRVGRDTFLSQVIRLVREAQGPKVPIKRLPTGDNERTAQAIAAEVGIDAVRAGVLPQGKIEAADITLVRGDLTGVVDAVRLSQSTFRKIV